MALPKMKAPEHENALLLSS